MIQETKNNLERVHSFQNWSKLASLTLSRIILFNKSSGEAARMKIEHYTKRPLWQSQGVAEITESLTEFGIKLVNALTVVEIIGKRGKKVPVLFTKEMKESVDFLLATRIAVGVPKGNPSVFARLGDLNSYMKGHDCIKKWCSEANLESPDTITSTKSRKYVATVCQVLNPKENECDWLARHLGHDIRVHREFYRLHENTVELTKVSRLLLAVDQSKAHTFAGESLKDIEVQEDDSPDQNDDEPSDGEDGETLGDSADVPGCSTANEEGELTSEPIIGKKKQKSSTSDDSEAESLEMSESSSENETSENPESTDENDISFTDMLTTPELAHKYDTRRRNLAINSRAQVVTKDLFKESTVGGKTLEPVAKTSKKNPPKIPKGKMEEKKSESWYCKGCQEDRVADMRLCVICKCYLHDECLGLTKEDKIEGYICPYCS
ncbi:unnamed protein product [Ceutorhynchus assimilis]|uniref:Zinc finger PHD-type domain-containing protein n=1 Tax=Ceutorhynchus assimilis TaxID=467358 RepID=A0A9N9MX66_9CUCU|nr:unnamed protein product [Ceutorhynchus assimilis]